MTTVGSTKLRRSGRCSLLPVALALAIVAVLLTWTDAAVAQAQRIAKPNVPPGTDPGGIAIAIVGFGIDYTDAEIAPRLARDGEGELIGWDFVDGDRKPFANVGDRPDTHGDGGGTSLAKLALSVYRHARLIPIRVHAGSAPALANAIAFATRTPAAIVALPTLELDAQHDDLMRRAAGGAGRLLVIASVALDAALAPPKLDNVLLVGAASSYGRASAAARARADAWIIPRGSNMFGARPGAAPASAAEAVAMAAGLAACAQHRREPATGAAAKMAALSLATASPADSGLKTLDPLCLYGGRPF